MSQRGTALRVLVYGVNFAPDSVGIPKYTGELSTWLAARGHRVDAIAGMPHYPEWRIPKTHRGKGFHTEIIDGVTVHRTPIYVPNGKRVRPRHRMLLELSFLLNSTRPWLPVLLRRELYDVVIAVYPSLQSGHFPWLYRLTRSVPWVFHVQDLQVQVAHELGLLRHPLLQRALMRLESSLLRRATRVSTISEAMRKRIVDKGVAEDCVWMLPNWADTRAICPMPSDNAFRRRLGVAPEQVLVVYAGAVGEKQGLEVVLQAAQRLIHDPQIRLAVIGDGSARRRLEALAVEMRLPNIAFLPRQSRDVLPEMMAAADIHLVMQRAGAADLVLPSKLGNILAAGRPAIGTAHEGTEVYDLLRREQIGLACPPENPDGLAQRIRQLAANPHRRIELGSRAREYATRYLDKETILEQFNENLISLVATRAPGATPSKMTAPTLKCPPPGGEAARS